VAAMEPALIMGLRGRPDSGHRLISLKASPVGSTPMRDGVAHGALGVMEAARRPGPEIRARSGPGRRGARGAVHAAGPAGRVGRPAREPGRAGTPAPGPSPGYGAGPVTPRPSDPTRRASAWLGLLLVAALAAPPDAHAQDNGATAAAPADPAAAPATPPPPEFIPVSNVISEAAKLDQRLAELEASVRIDDFMEKMEAEMARVEQRAQETALKMEATLGAGRLLSDLYGLESDWRALDARLASLGGTLDARSDDFDAARNDIIAQSELWERTGKEAQAAGAPPEVTGEVQRMRARLDGIRERVEKARDSVLGLESRVLELRRDIEPRIEEVRTAESEAAQSLFVPQRPPLWADEEALHPDAAGSAFAALGQRLSGATMGLGEYVERNRVSLALLLGVIGTLFWFAVRARRVLRARLGDRVEELAEQEPGSSTLDALRHPVAIAILTGIFASGFLGVESSFAIRLLFFTVGIPLWVLVVRGILPKPLHGAVLGVGLLALADLLQSLLAGFVLLPRLLLLVAFGAGFAGALWLRRPQRMRFVPRGGGQGPWFRILDLWLRGTLLLFPLGFALATLGYLSLGGRILHVVVLGTVLGGGYLAVVRVLEAVLEVGVHSGRLNALRMLRSHPELVLDTVSRLLRASALLLWLLFLLSNTQLLDPLLGAADAALGASVTAGSLEVSLGGVLAFFLTLYLAWLLSRFLSFGLEEEVFPRFRMRPGVPYSLATFSRYTVLVMGFVMAVAAMGISLDRVVLLLSALGVGIGFGLQNVVNNFVSGAILLFERPVRVGDTVEIDTLFGVVNQIGIRASRIRTYDGSDVVVPNGDLVAARLVNWTLSDVKRRVIVPFGVEHGTDPARVLEILGRVAKEHPEVLAQPEPELLFRGIGASALEFELRCWTESPRGFLYVMSDLATGIDAGLREAGIKIAFSQHDLHLRNAGDVGEAMARALQPRGQG